MGSDMFTGKVLVRPSIPPVPGYIPVTPLDQYMARVIIPIICVFRVTNPSDRVIILQNLQTGLSHSLDEMPFLAASIIPESEEDESIQLDYNDYAGVWFHTKDVPRVRFEELSQLNFPVSALPVSEFVPEPRGHSPRCPVLTVQATFITGGLVLAFNVHHNVMDARGAGTFLSVWSKQVTAASKGRLVPQAERLGETVLDASAIYGASVERPLSDFPIYRAAEGTPFQHRQTETFLASQRGDHEAVSKLVRLSHWSMSQEKMKALRDTAVPLPSIQSSHTDHAILSSLIWIHVSKARGLSNCQVTYSSLLSPVCVRRKMEPPLAVEYPGNSIVLARAIATPAELEGPETKTLHTMARRIADSIDWWTADEIWSLTGAIQANPTVRMVPPLEYDIFVTSPSQVDELLTKVEWGPELGSIQAFRCLIAAPMDGFVIVLPSIQGGIDVMLWTASETIDQLKNDPGWMQWVSQVE